MMQTVAGPSSGVEFEQWISPHLPSLRRLAATYAPAADREDLLQDTLVRAWTKRETFDPSRGEAKNWLLAVLADQGRKRWRRRGPALIPEQRAPTPGPDSTATDLRRAVNRLPRRQREVVVLCYYVDLPMAQIAELLGCSLGTVKSSLHDAKQRLSTELRDYEY